MIAIISENSYQVKPVPLSNGNIEAEIENEQADRFASFARDARCNHEVISYDIIKSVHFLHINRLLMTIHSYLSMQDEISYGLHASQ